MDAFKINKPIETKTNEKTEKKNERVGDDITYEEWIQRGKPQVKDWSTIVF